MLNLLRENNNCENYSLNKITVKPQSFEECLLELNDSIHEAYIDDYIDGLKSNMINRVIYKSILEDTNNTDNVSTTTKKKENIFRRIYNAFKKWITGIIDHFRNIFNWYDQLNDKMERTMEELFRQCGVDFDNYTVNYTKTNESAVDNSTDSIKTFFSDTREFTLFHFPSSKDISPTIYDFLIQSIDRIILPKIRNSNNKTQEEIITDIKTSILDGIFKQLPKSDIKSFTSADDYKEYVSSICYRETVVCSGKEYMENFNKNKDNSIASNSSAYTKKMNDLNRALDKMLSSFANSSDKDKDSMIIALTFLSDIAKLTTQLINKSIREYFNMGNYFLKVFAPYTKSSKNEAGFIHGEPFDGDTLFANGDPRDFNPTEWMNLELTTEMYEIRYAIRECRKNIAIKEANIILNGVDPKRTINELVSMREAEEKKFNLNIDTIILRISEMINKFLGFVKDKFNQDSMLLKKNAEKMKEPFKFEKVSSKGDILAGIDRVQTHFDIRYDESTMKDDTKKDIFEKQVLPKLNDGTGKRKLSWAPDKMEISEYCKLYFGAPMSDSAEGFTLCEYTGTELNGAKDKITGFIHNFNRITASINNDLNSLKVESKKLGVKTNTPNTATQQQTSTTASSTVEPQNNSACYYSILYDRYINEADIVKYETESNRNDNTNDDNKSATNGPNEYFNCYKDVIAAKLTAIEFIHSELMQIIRNHLGIKPTPEKGKDDNKK